MIRNWMIGDWAMTRKRFLGLLAAVALCQATAAVASAGDLSWPVPARSSVPAHSSVLAQIPVLAQIKTTQSGAKNYVVESLVVVALFGAALFIVCKTSRRS